MANVGLDLSGNIAQQLTPEIVDKADRIIALCPDENLPDFVRLSNNGTFERISIPGPMTYDSFVQVKDDVKQLVEKLVREISSSGEL